MRYQAWRWILGGLLLGATWTGGTAWADRVYFKDGTSVWGEFAEDLGSVVRIFSGGRTLEFQKESVVRIEQKKTNLPDYHVATPPPPIPRPSGGVTVIPGGASAGSGGTTSGGCRSAYRAC